MDRRGRSTFHNAGSSIFGAQSAQTAPPNWSQQSIRKPRVAPKLNQPRIYDTEASKGHITAGFQGQQDWFEDYKIAKHFGDPHGMKSDHVNLQRGGPQDDNFDAFYRRNQLGKRVYNDEHAKAAVQPRMTRIPPRPRPAREATPLMEHAPNRTQEWTKGTTQDEWGRQIITPIQHPMPSNSEWPSRSESRMQADAIAADPRYHEWGNPGNNVGGADHFTAIGVANGNNFQERGKLRLTGPGGHFANGMVSDVDGRHRGKKVNYIPVKTNFQNGMPIVMDSGARHKPMIKISGGQRQMDHFTEGMAPAQYQNDAPQNGRKHEYKDDNFVNIGVTEGDGDDFRSQRRVIRRDSGLGHGLDVLGNHPYAHKGSVEGRYNNHDHWTELQKPPSQPNAQDGTYPQNLGAHAATNRRFANRQHGKAQLSVGLVFSEDKQKTRDLGPYVTSYHQAHYKNFKSKLQEPQPEPAWSSNYTSYHGREDGIVEQRLLKQKPNGLRNTYGQLKIG